MKKLRQPLFIVKFLVRNMLLIKEENKMKKIIVLLTTVVLIISLSACSKQKLEDMTSGTEDGVSSIVWGDKTYVPYGPLSAYGDRGKQIGIVDGDKDYKAYECKGYSADEWIATAFSYDAAMLYREINVTDIPEGWQSEYEWNNPKQNEKSFFGKVIESQASYIVVEPNEDEEESKLADKISIELGEYNDALYMVGTNVKITYDGKIMRSYPAQVYATKIEVKSAEDFEILFYDKHPMADNKIYTILDKSETDKYDYSIYGYDGSVNIRIDGKDYSLKEALLENRITMEEIIVKANKDFPDAVSYDDGGSIEYHYDNYTIIKCHTLDGNRDVYIGTKDLKLNDVI